MFIIMNILSACNSPNTSPKPINLEGAVAALPLQEIDFLKDYTISNEKYGTKTEVILKDGQRVMQTNALPNHPTGKFPNPNCPNGITPQNETYNIPVKPTLSGESKWTWRPGIAVNGIFFEPETAEKFVCETGQVYKIEAFQDLVNLGLDFNHAHVQPTGAYHYLGIPVDLVKELDKGEDLIMVGFALDGFPIYCSKSGKYKPSFRLSDEPRTGDACSYRTPKVNIEENLQGTNPNGTFVSDWVYEAGLGQLDECNGIEVNGTYAYFVTKEYPYMSRCLKGVFKGIERKGPPPHRHGPPPPNGKKPPKGDGHKHGPGHDHNHDH